MDGGDFQSPMTIPIQGEDGQQSITIDPSMMESIDVPFEGQTQNP